ncbi:YdeI/OmpD-associated family protein [Rhodococcus sp. G-MC3]|uniref:YdeI/OmpD-associated family protein n=1 Tax=Rhodococcus sp. G-MC3 TaxID=3046209 RepID=UPI003FA7B60F
MLPKHGGIHGRSIHGAPQRRLVIPIEGAKAAETRQRRIASTIEKLLAGRS